MKESLFIPLCDNGMGLSRTRWAASMFAAALSGVLADRRIIVQTFGHPDPSASMNICTADFLESGCDRMVIIDTDHIFTPEQLGFLLSHDLEFVSGIYPKKVPGLEYPVVPLHPDQTPASIFDKSAECPVEVSCVPRGFLNLHRSVFEKLQPFVETMKDEQTGKPLSLFWRGIPGVMSEDFALCCLWRRHGGKVFVDPRVNVKHEGHAIYPIPGTF